MGMFNVCVNVDSTENKFMHCLGPLVVVFVGLSSSGSSLLLMAVDLIASQLLA